MLLVAACQPQVVEVLPQVQPLAVVLRVGLTVYEVAQASHFDLEERCLGVSG
jgi:hypothetical protein